MEKKTNKTVETKPIVEEVEFSIGDDPKVKGYEAKLFELRKDGVLKIAELNEEISSIKHNKMVDVATKDSIVAKDKEKLEEAKKVKADNKEKINALVKEAVAYVKVTSKKHELEVAETENANKTKAVEDHKVALAKLEEEH